MVGSAPTNVIRSLSSGILRSNTARLRRKYLLIVILNFESQNIIKFGLVSYSSGDMTSDNSYIYQTQIAMNTYTTIV